MEKVMTILERQFFALLLSRNLAQILLCFRQTRTETTRTASKTFFIIRKVGSHLDCLPRLCHALTTLFSYVCLGFQEIYNTYSSVISVSLELSFKPFNINLVL
jgi:hypothetical protein